MWPRIGQRSAEKNVFEGAKRNKSGMMTCIVKDKLSNKRILSGSVPNTTMISYRDEWIIARVNRASKAISLRSCERSPPSHHKPFILHLRERSPEDLLPKDFFQTGPRGEAK